MLSELTRFVLTVVQTSWVTSTTWKCLEEITPFFKEPSMEIHSDTEVPKFIKPSYIGSPSSVGAVDLVIIALNASEVSIQYQKGRVILVTSTISNVKHLWTKHKLIDILILKNNQTFCESYTWFPYKTCPDFEVIPLKVWKPKTTSLRENELFPVKVEKNLRGCDFLTFSEFCYPYTIKNSNISHPGAEIMIMDAVTKKLNLTKVDASIKHTPFVYTDEKGNLVNAPKLLFENELDLYYGCLTLTPELIGRISFLPMYYEESLEWFFPPQKNKPPISGLYSGLRQRVWIGIFIAYLSFSIYLYLANLRRDWKLSLISCFFLTFGCLLNITSRDPPKNNLIRMSMAIYYLFSIHIAAFYQACLLGNLYFVPKEKPYTDVIDGFNRGLDTILRYTQKRMFNATSHDVWNTIMTPNRHTITLYIDYNKVVQEQSAMFLGVKNVDLSILYYKYPTTKMKNLVQSLQKPFLKYPITMMMPLGHPLEKLISNAIARLLEGGLTERWRDEAMSSFTKLGENVEEEDDFVLTAIDLNRLQSAFYLFGCLTVFNVVVFLFEITSNCVKRTKQK